MSALVMRVHAAVVCRLGDFRRGATAVEYGLLLAVIVVVIMGAVSAFAGASNNLYTRLAEIASHMSG
jgi:Flp pilus assembly pilin Flp